MIDQKFNKAVTLMDDIYQLKEDIEKCRSLKAKQILTKRMDELQEEHDRLQEINLSNTNKLIAIDSLNTSKKTDGFTLKQRIETISKQYPEIEIDLVFRNKLENE